MRIESKLKNSLAWQSRAQIGYFSEQIEDEKSCGTVPLTIK